MKNSLRQRVQNVGHFLSSMVMPNIGAFIAWGLITAFFIPNGWLPNKEFSLLVEPMIYYLLPLLIAYTGGANIYGKRGGVVGATAALGVIVGAEIPMFIGAMLVGPLAGLLVKKVDELFLGKIRVGFEMLFNNFAAGLVAMFFALLGLSIIGPAIESLSTIFGGAVESIVRLQLLPLASIIIEPAKVLFLNNAINHGILSQLGISEAAQTGQSIFFLLETNPGPGLGILLAYYIFGKGASKTSSPGAIIIHFFGGIHEIYFPYIIMNPLLIIALILGGATGVTIFSLLGVGLISAPSPGSILSIVALAPRGQLLGVLLGVIMSTVVSLLTAAPLIRMSQDKNVKETRNDEMLELPEDVNLIVVACDAGMGSSAMGATELERRLLSNGISIDVTNTAIDMIPDDADIVITQKMLTNRARRYAKNAIHISIDNYLDVNNYTSIVDFYKKGNVKGDLMKMNETNNVLTINNIKLGLASVTKDEAITKAGKDLVRLGYVEEPYVDAMHQREKIVTTYIGNYLAIPHGVVEAKEVIKSSGIVIHQYPNGVDFGNGKIAYLVIGIAGRENEHLSILSNIAQVFEDENTVLEMSKITDESILLNKLTNINEV